MRWLWRSAFRQRVQLRFIYDRLFSTLCIKPVTLRPYQEQCLSACEDALEGGNSRIGVSLPTGAGKTTIFISLLARIKSSSPKSTRSIVIVNSVELARQTAEQVSRLFPSWTVEIEQGARYKASGSADVTVATYQTLLQPERIAKFDVETLKAIIVDEAHHAAAPSYRRILSHFDPEIKNPDPQFVPPRVTQKIPIVGFSATFSRHDGLALGSIFQRIVYHRDFLNMIKEQWLCDVRFTNVKANINLKEVTVNSRTGDFNPTSLAQVINTDTINHLVVQTWLDRAASERKSTLVFCVNVAHVEALTQVFRGFGIDARYIYSKTPAAERKALVSAFKNGQFPVLLNCAILTEGADIPNIDCVIVARPTRSRNVFAQMIGRGMRLSPGTGKTDCRIIDFVDSLDRVSGVVSSPTLFGLDPDEVTEDESLESMEQRATESIGPSNSDSMDDIPEPTSITYTDYDNPFSFVQDSSGTPSHVMQLSSNAWVGCGNEIYVLECLGKGFVKIEHDEGDEETEPHYRASFTPAALDKETAKGLKITPYFRSRHVLTANKLDEAIRGCDTYVKNKVVRGPLAVGLLRSARWRKTPATPQQVKFIAKRWSKRLDDSNQKLDSLTKGEAANIISRLKHGAQSRYQKKAKVASTAAKVAAKEAQRRNRETVRVGPLPQPTS
ncbi:P-loop containing nucleoside triphosphate hydrolase protein [Dendrothele bispora CBS 962.96]|uniref:P-loop containing nucleoside triphosphate hydrolase protein n=1 Tax=Dendrothele bispora (strain CBS 962.96) TaxID=1314807 RepID=A0A4S8MWL6_DENBC|nr:P-loop containing nucleoside triphosphate hydrolase protein [Dendrothele bispora CBS 962.96]